MNNFEAERYILLSIEFSAYRMVLMSILGKGNPSARK
jgi:hypothetical protein